MSASSVTSDISTNSRSRIFFTTLAGSEAAGLKGVATLAGSEAAGLKGVGFDVPAVEPVPVCEGAWAFCNATEASRLRPPPAVVFGVNVGMVGRVLGGGKIPGSVCNREGMIKSSLRS